MDDESTNDDSEDFAKAVLDTPTIFVVGRQLSAAKRVRAPTTLPVEVLALDRSIIEEVHTSIPPGAAVLVVSTDPDTTSAIRHNADSGQYTELDSSIKTIISSFGELKASHYAAISDAAHIIDVTIGSRRLADSILLEDRASYTDVYPFMGGDIDAEILEVVDYSSAEASERVDVTLILSQPDLTEVERAVLSALPGDREALVGEGAVAALPAVWAVARGAWAAYQVGKYLYKEYKQTRAWRDGGVAQLLEGDELGGRVDIPDQARVSELLEARALLLRARLARSD